MRLCVWTDTTRLCNEIPNKHQRLIKKYYKHYITFYIHSEIYTTITTTNTITRVLTYSYQMHVVFHTTPLLHFWNFFVFTRIFIVKMEAGISVAQNKEHKSPLNNNATPQKPLSHDLSSWHHSCCRTIRWERKVKFTTESNTRARCGPWHGQFHNS